jgi:hypothetical protein
MKTLQGFIGDQKVLQVMHRKIGNRLSDQKKEIPIKKSDLFSQLEDLQGRAKKLIKDS